MTKPLIFGLQRYRLENQSLCQRLNSFENLQFWILFTRELQISAVERRKEIDRDYLFPNRKSSTVPVKYLNIIETIDPKIF